MRKLVFKIDPRTLVIVFLVLLVGFLVGLVYFLWQGKSPSIIKTLPGQTRKTSPVTQSETYSYNENITLSGLIQKHYYGSDERYVLALFLDQPIDMQAGKSDFEIAYENVDKLQFINENNLAISQYENQRVTITGELMPAHTGHHMTDVLLVVASLNSEGTTNQQTTRKQLPLAEKKNSLVGFYTHYDKMDWGDIPVTCDALTVTGGDQSLISKYKKMVEEGNGINRVDYQDRLIMNLSLDTIDSTTRSTITSSTPGSPVEVTVQELALNGFGVHACFSFVEIVSAKSVN